MKIYFHTWPHLLVFEAREQQRREYGREFENSMHGERPTVGTAILFNGDHFRGLGAYQSPVKWRSVTE